MILLAAGRGGGTFSACLETSWAAFAAAGSVVWPSWAQAKPAASQKEAVMVRPRRVVERDRTKPAGLGPCTTVTISWTSDAREIILMS